MNHSEHSFENNYVIPRLEANGYNMRQMTDFDFENFVDQELLFQFIHTTQPESWQKLAEKCENPNEEFLYELNQSLKQQFGTLKLLHHGLEVKGVPFSLTYYPPYDTLNQDLNTKYKQNIFSYINQFRFNLDSSESVDVVLFMNGVPVVTAELKNNLSSQNTQDAVNQYQNRDPKIRFWHIPVVHFALDNETAKFATHINGVKTKFLHFNKGIENPDPQDPDQFRTYYVYNDTWLPQNLLEIFGRFVRIVEDKDGDFVIFPRFHQLQAVQNLVSDISSKGVGTDYLIQHSAGSGKTFTISWLAHQLAQVKNTENQRVVDTVVVVSDRKVIDSQLEEAVSGFQKTKGVVKYSKKSSDLKTYLQDVNVNIIVTTAQKFPFVLDFLKDEEDLNTKDCKFAVIIDEAHSGQGGEMMKDLKMALNYENAPVEYSSDEVDEVLSAEMEPMLKAKAKLDSVSFFAFTATPTEQTLELFGKQGDDGKFRPFSLYSMQQAITEGYILDVLKNYTTFETYMNLSKRVADDPKFKKKKAMGLLNKYVQSHPKTIAVKCEIILDHYLKNVMDLLDGKAKAMIVTSSRESAYNYKLGMDELLGQMGKSDQIKTLVAFTGEVPDARPGNPLESKINEKAANNFLEMEIKEAFKQKEYKFLIVANKFQTGFDQPLLSAMYVDKTLHDLTAVQTLSRLNRAAKGKDTTFILDFANSIDDIRDAFSPYYTSKILVSGSNPEEIYSLKEQILNFGQIVSWDEIKSIVLRGQLGKINHANLQNILSSILHRFYNMPGLDEEQATNAQKEFKGLLNKYNDAYVYLSQLHNFADWELEAIYVFNKLLLPLLQTESERISKKILEAVDMDKLQIAKKVSNAHIHLEPDNVEVGHGDTDPTMGLNMDDEDIFLSEIIAEFNSLQGDLGLSQEQTKTLTYFGENLIKDKELNNYKGVNQSTSALKNKFIEQFDKTVNEIAAQDVGLFNKIVDPQNKDRVISKLFRLFINRE